MASSFVCIKLVVYDGKTVKKLSDGTLFGLILKSMQCKQESEAESDKPSITININLFESTFSLLYFEKQTWLTFYSSYF